jgi:hypothetical protein
MQENIHICRIYTIQAVMKLNRQIDSSHAGRLPDGRRVDRKAGKKADLPGRHTKKAYQYVLACWAKRKRPPEKGN